VNSAAQQIAKLNTEIRKVVASGEQPNDLRDQRNNLLDDLSKKANLTVLPQADGSVTVQIGGTAIVRGGDSMAITDAAQLAASGDLTSGEMKGLIDAQAIVKTNLDNIDAMAKALMTTVNQVQQNGVDLTGTPGVAFFAGTGAGDIAVNPTLANDPGKIAASSTPVPPATFAVGNGDNAQVFADLGQTKVTTGPITNQSLRDYWSAQAATLGVEVSALNSNVTGQDSFVKQLESRRDSVSGVSLDDEMADLIKFQRAYQAAAKLISVSDEMTQTLLNAFGSR
jgi:flagellar hook-associated protein 1 FlgK